MLRSTLLLFLLKITSILCKTHWVDPYSMDDDVEIDSHCNCPTMNCPMDNYSLIKSHYRRTVALIANSLAYNHPKKEFNGQFEYVIQEEDFHFIQKYLKQQEDTSMDLNRIDKILTNMVKRKGNYREMLSSWKDFCYTLISSKETTYIIMVIFVALLLYKLYTERIPIATFVKMTILFIIFIDFIYTWFYMLKEKELEQYLQMAYKVPPECNVSRMSWSQYFAHKLSTFGGHDECKEYHKIRDIDIFWTVSPIQVIGHQIGNFILAPAEKIGNAFGTINRAIFSSSSWWSLIPTLIFTPILLFGLIVIFCVLTSFITGRTFEFDCLQMFKFKFGLAYHPQNNRVYNVYVNDKTDQSALKGQKKNAVEPTQRVTPTRVRGGERSLGQDQEVIQGKGTVIQEKKGTTVGNLPTKDEASIEEETSTQGPSSSQVQASVQRESSNKNSDLIEDLTSIKDILKSL